MISKTFILKYIRRVRSGTSWVQSKNYCDTVKYVQGQSPEKNIREYFYFIDHQGMVNFFVCYIKILIFLRK